MPAARFCSKPDQTYALHLVLLSLADFSERWQDMTFLYFIDSPCPARFVPPFMATGQPGITNFVKHLI